MERPTASSRSRCSARRDHVGVEGTSKLGLTPSLCSTSALFCPRPSQPGRSVSTFVVLTIKDLPPERMGGGDHCEHNLSEPGMDQKYTLKQGQYLAFIYYFTKINGRAPAEADMQRYFDVSPPSVHSMILTLERQRFIERVPGVGRSIRLLLSRAELPDLE